MSNYQRHPSMSGHLADLGRRVGNLETDQGLMARVATVEAGGAGGVSHERLAFSSQNHPAEVSYAWNTVDQPQGLLVVTSDTTGNLTYTQTDVLQRVTINVPGIYAVNFKMDLYGMTSANAMAPVMPPNTQLDMLPGGAADYLSLSTHAAREVVPVATNRWHSSRCTRYDYSFIARTTQVQSFDPWLNVGNGNDVQYVIQVESTLAVTRIA